MRETLKVNEIAKELAGPSFSEAQAAAWFRKLAGDGPDDVFPTASAIGEGGGRPHFLYDRLTPAAAAVIRALWEFDSRDQGLLRRIYQGLVAKAPDGDSWIGHILACVAAYPADSTCPMLVVGRILDERTNEIHTRVDILDGQNPSAELAEHETPLLSVHVNCNALLRRYVKAPA